MRKNKKLLLASVAAMGALALGVGATSTFAWFVAGAASQQYAAKQTGGQFQTVNSDASLGSFTVTPVLTAPTENIVLTDNNGATKVYASGQVAEGKEIAASKGTNALEGVAKVKLRVSYSGSLATVAEVNAAWQATLAAVSVTISDESVDRTVYADMAAYNAAKDPDVDAETWASMTEAQKEKTPGLKIGNKAEGAGLKFKTSTFGVAGAGSHTGNSTISISFATSVLDDLTWSSATSETPETDDVSFYVAIKGINGIIQDETETYTIGALAANA